MRWVALAALAMLAGCGGPERVAAGGVALELAPGVRAADARDGELVRLRHAGGTLTARRIDLPAYDGDAAGLLPVFMTNHAARLGVTPTGEGRVRLGDAPGYEITFDGGREVVVAGPDGAVLLALRRGGPKLRSALRSLELGRDGG